MATLGALNGIFTFKTSLAMHNPVKNRLCLSISLILFLFGTVEAQKSFKLRYKNSLVYAGIEVGSKGVKMSVLEIGKNAKKNGTFNVLKDTTINTDFISFSTTTYHATATGLWNLYQAAVKDYKIPSDRVFLAVSSGVQIQAEKDKKQDWINKLVDSFKTAINEPARKVRIMDVTEEARLSHLGIVPDAKRYNTFLIDIGSGNTKGGYFPIEGDTKTLKLFQLTWGTKSIANAVEKRSDEDKSMANFKKQMYRVLEGSPNTEITYAVNVSGAYAMSDNVVFSGGIAWSVATLMYPELIDNGVVPTTYDEVVKFSEKIYKNYTALNDTILTRVLGDGPSKALAIREIRDVNKTFDQKGLMAGTALLLKIMRQFEGIEEKKQFFLVKNGQVGWISAFVDENVVQQ
jgi:hypothetical protein